jgi:hypothetical protein
VTCLHCIDDLSLAHRRILLRHLHVFQHLNQLPDMEGSDAQPREKVIEACSQYLANTRRTGQVTGHRPLAR